MTDAATDAQPASPDLARQAAVIAALTATLTVNTLAELLPLNGQSTGEIAARFPLPIVPAGYAFSIWGLIYSGVIGYAVYQALPSQRNNKRLRRLAWPFVVSCACNIAWLLLWHYNQYGLTIGAMVGLLLALITIDLRLGRVRGGSLAERLLVRLPFSIYLGWVSVATIVNGAVALSNAGWDGLGLDAETWTAVLLATGAALAGVMGVGRGDAAFPATIAWAFAAVAVKNNGTPVVEPAARAATLAALLASGGALVRRPSEGS